MTKVLGGQGKFSFHLDALNNLHGVCRHMHIEPEIEARGEEFDLEYVWY